MSRQGLSDDQEASIGGVFITLKRGTGFAFPNLSMAKLEALIDDPEVVKFRSRDSWGDLRLIMLDSISDVGPYPSTR